MIDANEKEYEYFSDNNNLPGQYLVNSYTVLDVLDSKDAAVSHP
jgi:hypothetical protein